MKKRTKEMIFKALMYFFGLIGISSVTLSLLSIYTTRPEDGAGRWVAIGIVGLVLTVISVIGLSMEDEDDNEY